MATFTGPKKLKYVSQKNAASIGWTEGIHGDPATVSDSDPCSGAVTFEQGLLWAHQRGARLPTLQEILDLATKGSGCGYDYEMIWCIDMVNDDPNIRYVCYGDPTRSDAPNPLFEPRAITSTAYVRMIADVDKNRPDPVEIYDRMVLDIIYGAGYSL